MVYLTPIHVPKQFSIKNPSVLAKVKAIIEGEYMYQFNVKKPTIYDILVDQNLHSDTGIWFCKYFFNGKYTRIRYVLVFVFVLCLCLCLCLCL